MQAKVDEIAELKRNIDDFSDQNPDIINRVSFITELQNNGMVVVNENGEYQLASGGN